MTLPCPTVILDKTEQDTDISQEAVAAAAAAAAVAAAAVTDAAEGKEDKAAGKIKKGYLEGRGL